LFEGALESLGSARQQEQALFPIIINIIEIY
jgi:hypothetical protein